MGKCSHDWQPPELPENIPHGDMPGDKVEIGQSHIQKAQTIFPLLLQEIQKVGNDKLVVSVCGGSGVGKSEIASLLCFYLNEAGMRIHRLIQFVFHMVTSQSHRKRNPPKTQCFRGIGVPGAIRTRGVPLRSP